MRRGAGASFGGVLLLAQLCLAGDCVDGVTPDCSDAATQCGPNLDGATFDAPADASEASVDATVDAPADVAADAPSDASDQ